jgi:DNA-binding response OmpR family regulator
MPEKANSSQRFRILCTEDDADTREVLRLLLELEGFVVTCAEDSDQALRFAKSEKFDLFLLDNWLPGMDGDHLCQELRQMDASIPILFYSGATAPADRALAMAAGAQGYVVKPATPDELTSEIRRLIPA